eukprot:m.116102 g.116102  ORF g.116102 m.116102 type:complete len:95 (-) comp17164_c0_seq13:228-512(-)
MCVWGSTDANATRLPYRADKQRAGMWSRVARIWRYIRLFKGGHDAQDKKKSRGRGKHRPGGAHPTMPVEMGESYVDDDMNVPFSATAAPDATEC